VTNVLWHENIIKTKVRTQLINKNLESCLKFKTRSYEPYLTKLLNACKANATIDVTRAVAKNFLWGGFSSIDRNFIEDITIGNYIE